MDLFVEKMNKKVQFCKICKKQQCGGRNLMKKYGRRLEEEEMKINN
jgi:hypothetical protein